jgi:hypothetical protein
MNRSGRLADDVCAVAGQLPLTIQEPTGKLFMPLPLSFAALVEALSSSVAAAPNEFERHKLGRFSTPVLQGSLQLADRVTFKLE